MKQGLLSVRDISMIIFTSNYFLRFYFQTELGAELKAKGSQFS